MSDQSVTKPRRRRMPLHTQIAIGLTVGVAAGLAANLGFGGDHPRVVWLMSYVTEPVGQLFMRLLLMTVLPLVFSSLVIGVAGIRELRALGRIGLKSFVYCLVISAVSVAIGITLVNVIQPGKRIDPATSAALESRYSGEAATRIEAVRAAGGEDSPVMQVVKTIVPSNPLSAMAGDPPNLLHLMFFALILGIAITRIPESAGEPAVRLCEAIFRISTTVIDGIMRLAPYAVGCLLFNNLARFGPDLLKALSWFIATVLIGLTLHMFGVYSLSVAVLSRISPMAFFARIRTVIMTAFSTSSSNATLPTALEVSEKNLNVPRHINNFVLTVGATANQNGTALYEGVTILFLAQLAGIPLSLGQQIMIAYMAILGGIGTAGVPSGSIPFIIIVLTSIGVNPSLITIILGVDRVLDMCRTTLNVTGDITAATYVARSEGHQLMTTPESEWL